jgi:hypothetical protein
MQPLTDQETLSCWEEGFLEKPVQQSLRLLAAAIPESSLQDLASLSIGERDQLLITLCGLMFGQKTECISTCPSCGEQIEFSCVLSDFSYPQPKADRKSMTFSKNGYTVVFRLPTSADLIEISAVPDREIARKELFRKCILSVVYRKKKVPPEKIPPDVEMTALSHMEETDPFADIRLSLRCTACGKTWEETFDIGSFLWNEIQARAIAILYDVHALARAYGWAETAILTMSPERRSLYREMIHQ